MAFDYADMAAAASEMLAEFGQAATIVRATPATPGPNPGAPTPANHPCTVFVDTYRTFERDGTMIKAGDKKVLVSIDGLAITPAPSDKIVIGGVTHNIVAVEPLNPGGTALMYTVQARA